MPNDSIREERPQTFPADQGTSLTSHGDGEPSIDRRSVEIREETIKAEEQAERKLRDDADKLLKSSSSSGSGSSKK